MLKTSLFVTMLSVTTLSHATCITDEPEIGDVGPASEYVCAMLAASIPTTDIVILDRTLLSPSSVSIAVSLDGRQRSLKYVLRGAHWVLGEASDPGR